MNKKQVRTKYKQLRKELSTEEIESQSLEIANQVLKIPVWDYSFYHVFLSISEKKEVDTQMLLHILQGKDKNIVVSKAHFESSRLSHFLLTDSTKIKKNAWNIPEPVDGIEISPEKIEVVFIPLLAFDLEGNRLGYGKGFYDRFLSECTKQVVKIGLSFFPPEEKLPEVSALDVPLDFCVTPSEIYSFKNL